MHKLLAIAYGVLKSGKLFDPASALVATAWQAQWCLLNKSKGESVSQMISRSDPRESS